MLARVSHGVTVLVIFCGFLCALLSSQRTDSNNGNDSLDHCYIVSSFFREYLLYKYTCFSKTYCEIIILRNERSTNDVCFSVFIVTLSCSLSLHRMSILGIACTNVSAGKN